MKILHTPLVLAMGMICTLTHAAGLRVQTVETEGTGPTREKAITAALAEAVARVNGLALESRDVSRVAAEIKNRTEANNDSMKSDSKTKLSENLNRETTTKTQGSVRSYQVLHAICEGDVCTAKLSVDINKFEADVQSNRRRIAVLPLRAKGGNQQAFIRQTNQAIVNYLTGTRHFTVLDRDYEKERLGELQSLMRDDVLTAERARIGNSLGTDYIVTGTVEELSTERKTEIVPYVNEKVTSTLARVVLNWRVIEAATGQIMVSKTVTQNLRLKGEESLHTVGDRIGTQIAETINDIIYPILVVSYQPDTKRVVLAQGGHTLTSGREYRLVRYGQLHHDPYTGEPMGREEVDVGRVRISQLTPKIAYADVIATDVDLRGAAPREYLLRALEQTSDKQSSQGTSKTMTPAW